MDKVLLVVYEIFLTIALIVFGPLLIIKKKARCGLLQNLGFIPEHLKAKLRSLTAPVWFHTVSVGEFNAALPFIEAFHQRFPNQSIVISTTTETGQKLAQKHCNKMATIIYFPFDLSWIVSKWL